MLIQGLMFRACSVGGLGYKPPLCSRLLTPLYQQCAGVKSIESQLGLPERPKRPLAVFLLFAQTVRPKLMAENPGKPAKDIAKLIGEEWKKCDEKIKKKLAEQAQKESAKYVTELEKYYLSLSREDLEAIKEAKSKMREVKALREQEKLRKLNKPKRPPNAYSMFLMDEIAKGNFKGVPFAERSKKLGELWKQLPEGSIAEYHKTATEAMKKYKADIEEWEESMVASGHIDVCEPRRKTKKQE